MHRHPNASENCCETAPDDVKELSAVVDIVASVGGGSRIQREYNWHSASILGE
jgi:hypothetical protein